MICSGARNRSIWPGWPRYLKPSLSGGESSGPASRWNWTRAAGRSSRCQRTSPREVWPRASLSGSSEPRRDSQSAERPHQALDAKAPADRFAPVPAAQRSLVDLWLPGALENAEATAPPPAAAEGVPAPVSASQDGGPVEFDRVVPPSGNLQIAGKQFWLGPARAGTVIRFWADSDLVCLSAAATRIKALRSHLSRPTCAGSPPAVPFPPGPARCPSPPAPRQSRSSGLFPAADRSASGRTACWPRRSSAGSWSASASSPPP